MLCPTCNPRLDQMEKPVSDDNFIGKTISCDGNSYTIDKVISVNGFAENWHIEFYDTDHIYHEWRQNTDGGKIK